MTGHHVLERPITLTAGPVTARASRREGAASGLPSGAFDLLLALALCHLTIEIGQHR
jgi:hypothetical protein